MRRALKRRSQEQRWSFTKYRSLDYSNWNCHESSLSCDSPRAWSPWDCQRLCSGPQASKCCALFKYPKQIQQTLCRGNVSDVNIWPEKKYILIHYSLRSLSQTTISISVLTWCSGGKSRKRRSKATSGGGSSKKLIGGPDGSTQVKEKVEVSWTKRRYMNGMHWTKAYWVKGDSTFPTFPTTAFWVFS